MQDRLSGFEIFSNIKSLKNEREDVVSVRTMLSSIDVNNTFSKDFILSHTKEDVDFFQDKVLFPIQGSRLYESLSPELEKFFLFDIACNEDNLIKKAKKDFNKLKEAIEPAVSAIIYETMKMVEYARKEEGFHISDIKITIENDFIFKHMVNFFNNYFKVGVIRDSQEENPVFNSFRRSLNSEGKYHLELKTSSKSLIENKISFQKYLDVISAGCSGAVKTDKMTKEVLFFEDISLQYMGETVDNVTHIGDFNLISNKKRKKIKTLFYQN